MLLLIFSNAYCRAANLFIEDSDVADPADIDTDADVGDENWLTKGATRSRILKGGYAAMRKGPSGCEEEDCPESWVGAIIMVSIFVGVAAAAYGIFRCVRCYKRYKER